jgi:hypothetical protein
VRVWRHGLGLGLGLGLEEVFMFDSKSENRVRVRLRVRVRVRRALMGQYRCLVTEASVRVHPVQQKYSVSWPTN